MADIFDFYVYDDRSIQFALAEPIMLEDKDVTQFRFRIPKVLNNIDMTTWEWWFIFVNAKKVKYTTQLTLTDDEDDPDNYSNATYTVGYGFSGYVGTVSFSIEALNVSGDSIVNEWHTKTYTTHVIDTLQGTRAVVPEPEGQTVESLISDLDARVTALEQGSGSGLSQAEKDLILTLFSKAAYAESDASTAYDALENLWTTTTRTITYNLSHVSSSNSTASIESGQSYTTTLTASTDYTLNTVTVTMGGVDITSTAYSSGTVTIPSVTGNIVITATAVLAAQSITAVYTQSGTVYDTASLDSLKPDLVVTANYSGGTSETVPASNYTLSGTLTEGTSTITVTYAGLTTTFNVTVSTFSTEPSIAEYDKTLGSNGVAGETTGGCYTNAYSFEVDIDAIKNTSYYDSTNNYSTAGGVIFKIKHYAPNVSGISFGSRGKNCQYDSSGTVITYGTPSRSAEGDFQDARQRSEYFTLSDNIIRVKFSLTTAEIDDSYAYWATPASGIMPIGVRAGDVIFAGRNTAYYGKQNIND